MQLEEFDYYLPEALIAQEPAPTRDQARLMIVDRANGTIRHAIFHSLQQYLQTGDVLVVNNSRVIPARLSATKPTGGRVEVFLLANRYIASSQHQTCETLLKPAKGLRPGMRLSFAAGCEAVIKERLSEKVWSLEFTVNVPFDDFLERLGITPLPPYIKRSEAAKQSPTDRERYQTIYAQIPGSVAAPTAGLHFTQEVLTSLETRGIPVAQLTLHVGYGTFSPLQEQEIEKHRMEVEHYEISSQAATLINQAIRTIAVGTTSARTLEAATDAQGRLAPGRAATDLFIYPGYRFKKVDALLTNFHLPKSSLYILVAGFTGLSLIREAYRQAIEAGYRFYSYGDCMLII